MTRKLHRIVEAGSVDELAHVLAGRDAPCEELSAALHQAARLGRVAFVGALVGAGAPVDAPASPGSWRPIHTAVEHRQLEVIRELVACGADINAKSENGMTPLHLAVDVVADSVEQVGLAGGLHVVSCLLDLGADPDIPDSAHQSPRDWARKSGLDVLAELHK